MYRSSLLQFFLSSNQGVINALLSSSIKFLRGIGFLFFISIKAINNINKLQLYLTCHKKIVIGQRLVFLLEFIFERNLSNAFTPLLVTLYLFIIEFRTAPSCMSTVAALVHYFLA